MAHREPITEDQIEVYMECLEGYRPEQLEVAFRRALRELKFFPKIAELIAFAEAGEERAAIEAEAAWQEACEYLYKWGVDRLPEYRAGRWIAAPPLAPRLEYALRRIGGLSGLNQITTDRRAFVYRDFCEAYAQSKQVDLPALPAKPQPQLQGENTGEPTVSFHDVAKQIAEVAKSKGMGSHERTWQRFSDPKLPPAPPPLRLTTEQIEKRRAAELEEIRKVKAKMEGKEEADS